MNQTIEEPDLVWGLDMIARAASDVAREWRRTAVTTGPAWRGGRSS